MSPFKPAVGTGSGITQLTGDVSTASGSGSQPATLEATANVESVIANAPAVTSKLPLAGGTMTGALTLSGDPTTALEAATKEYADATIPYDALVASLNPEAWWKLADAVGSTSAVDSSGNGYTLPSVSGATFGQSGPIAGTPSDTAVLMAGGQIYSGSGFASLSTFGSGDFSVGACIKPNSGAGDAVVLDTSTTYSGTDTGIFLSAGDTSISVDLGSDATLFTVPAMHTQWNHVLWSFVHATKTSSVYLNATLLGTFVHAGTPTIGATPQVSIGAQFGGHFSGEIAQCIFFPSALTASQVLALYNAAPKYGEQENNYVTTPTVTSGTAFTPSSTSNSMVTFQLNSASAGSYSLTMGSSTGSEITIASGVAMLAGSDELITLLVPRGYRVILTLTTTTLAGVKVITNVG